MRSLSEYIIKFEGLKQGIHFYEFNVDNSFFEEFDCFEFEKSSFKIDLELKKQSRMMVLTFNFSGTIVVPCDRCLDDVDVDVDGEEKLIIKFGNEEYVQVDEILILPEHEYQLNVAKYIYEFINVNLPQKRLDKAEKELEYSKWFDYIITNDNLENAQQEVISLVTSFLKK